MPKTVRPLHKAATWQPLKAFPVIPPAVLDLRGTTLFYHRLKPVRQAEPVEDLLKCKLGLRGVGRTFSAVFGCVDAAGLRKGEGRCRMPF